MWVCKKRVFFLFLLFLQGCTTPSLIRIAHRGASAQRPEHTRAAYELALDQGARWLEPDLVMTRDGILIIRHERRLDLTTDALQKFPRKIRPLETGGRTVYSDDLTLKEVRELRARERFPFRSQVYNGTEPILTFEEFLQWVNQESQKRGFKIGIIPELKEPGYFYRQGFEPERKLVELLKAYGYGTKKDPVWIQSFDPNSLKRLRSLCDLPLVQLLEPELNGYFWRERDGLVTIRRYADAVAPGKEWFLKEDPARVEEWIRTAKQLGLKLFTWTIRPEPQFHTPGFNAETEEQTLRKLGIDGIFVDF